MNNTKVNNNNSALLRDNSANGANNGDDIFSTIYERVLNIVGLDPDYLIGRYRYLTDHIVSNEPYKELKGAALSSVPQPKHETQEIKDTIKKCCDVYKSSVRDSGVIAIIDKICELIGNFYVANTESHNSEISSGDAANKHNNAESKYIEIAKEIVECYDKLQNQIFIIFWAKVLKNLPVKPSSLNKISQNQQEVNLTKSINTIKSTVTSLLVDDAVSKFLSEAKTQHSRINYLAIKELLLSLQRKINSLEGTDTKVTEELIRDIFYGFGVQNSAWELQESIGEKLSSFSTEFGTINVDGKNFKIVDSGSELHANCVFLSLKNGDQIFDSQTTGRDVKEYILKGTKKLKESLENEAKTEKDIKQLLSGCLPLLIKFFHLEGNMPDDINGILTTIFENVNIDEFLNEFKEYKPEMFINGADPIYLLLFAIGMGKQIVVVGPDNNISAILDPEKGLLSDTDDKPKDNDAAVYVCLVYGHMMKLEQANNMDNDADRATLDTEREAMKEKISTKVQELLSPTKQVITDAYEHFITACKCGPAEFPQLCAAYDAIKPKETKATEPQETNKKEDSDKQISKLMSEALVEIAILRPLYWMDYSKKLTHHFLLLKVFEVINNCVEFLDKKICDINISSKAEISQEKDAQKKELGELRKKLFEYGKIITKKMKNASKKSSDLEDFFE